VGRRDDHAGAFAGFSAVVRRVSAAEYAGRCVALSGWLDDAQREGGGEWLER
jgi:hypothetical protein